MEHVYKQQTKTVSVIRPPVLPSLCNHKMQITLAKNDPPPSPAQPDAEVDFVSIPEQHPHLT